MKRVFGLIVVLCLAAAPAQAAHKHAKKAVSDQSFIKEAAMGDMAEVQLGNLAKQKASSNDVRQFGDRMVADHSKNSDEVKRLAQQKNVQLPTDLDATHKAVVERLSKLSGSAFDKAYMREMLSDHKSDVKTFKRESKGARDSAVKSFASNTLPTLEDHLKLAENDAAKVGVPTGTSGHVKKSSKKGSGL